MKIGLLYEDNNTGELLMLDIFTRCEYVWVDVNGKRFEEEKTEAWKHMKTESCKDKQKIKMFFEKLSYTVWGLCHNCNKFHYSKFKKYVDESATGDENCPHCGIKLTYT